jgi:DNA repair exonuclease SbcCD ATPase subunit
MNFYQLEAEGFKAFRQPTALSFDEDRGLFFVQGQNLASPTLGANGAGKSTIWDALCWCLYGKTVRGTYGSSVSSWGSEGHTRVSLVLSVGGQSHTIERTRKPNALLLDGENVVQGNIDGLLQMNYAAFLNTVVFGQFNAQFADQSPAARLDVLSAALNLDVWDSLADASKEDVKSREGSLSGLEGSLSSARAAHAARQEDVASLRQRDEDWLEEVRQDEQRLQLKVQTKQQEIEALSSELEQVREDRRKKYAEEQEAKSQVADARRALETAQAKDLQLRTDLRAARERLQAIEAKVAGMQSAEGACPGCLQPITDAAREHYCAEGTQAAQKTRNEIAKIESTLHDGSDVTERLKSVISEQERRFSRAGKEAAALGATAASLPRALDAAERSYQEAQDDLQGLQTGQSPYGDLIEQGEALLAEGDAHMASLEADRDSLATTLEVARPWPKRFRQIRLWLLEEAVQELSALTSAALSQLGLDGWEIDYRLEKESSTGKITRSFEILVRSGATDGYVPWTSWSGGETQRLRLAISIALSTLLRSRMTSAPSLEVWDEPTTHLNADGVDDLIRLLGERAEQRAVYLVDHRTLDQGIFAGTVTITKDSDGLCRISRS